MNIFDMDKNSLPEQVQINKENIKRLMDLVGLTPNFTNPNLLINSNFKINQRGAASYSTVNQYTVDRWMLVSGSITVESVGITLNGTIQQTLESAPDGDVSVSSNAGDISYANGIVTISTTTPTLILWAKLEIGNTMTPYCVPDDATELLKCLRYYFKINASVPANKYLIYKTARSSYTMYDRQVILPVVMRTLPTITLYSANTNASGKLYNTTQSADQTFSTGYITQQSFQISNTNGDMSANDTIAGYYAADAEIY